MTRNLIDRLRDMKNAAELAIKFTANVKDELEFDEDALIRSAVERQIEIFCEAATKIGNKYPEFTQNHNEIEWEEIYGMRIILAHIYHRVESPTIWRVLKNYFPEIITQLDRLIDAEHRIVTRDKT